MKSKRSFLIKLLTITCLTLTSCKETANLKNQLSDTTAKIKALQEESANMNIKMVELRKHLPANIVSEVMIKSFSAQLAVGVVGIENEIATTKTSILEAATLLSQAQRELEALSALTMK